MADVMTAEQRSRNMAAVKGKNTKPEMIVRKYLFSRGLRYRLHQRNLPGSPDIVLKKYRTVIFVDGCFWHGHENCKYFRLPKSNVDFWRHKIAMNTSRDYLNTVELQSAGWRVIRIWECQIRTKAQREQTLSELYRQITAPSPHSNPYQLPDSSETQIAAEPPTDYGNNDSNGDSSSDSDGHSIV